jgi:VWFA-related protein
VRLATVVALFVAVAGFAQTAAPPPLAQRIDVTLVNVDVTVLDARGNPVMNLGKDDFEVREDGVLHEITNFAVFKSEKPAAKAQEDPAFASDAERRRSVVVLVDVRAIGEKPQRARAVDALQKILTQNPDDANWSVVVLRNGSRSMQTLLPMTTDRASINEALNAVRNGLTLPSSADQAIRRIRAVGANPGGSDVRGGIEAAQDMESAVSFFSAVVQIARGVAWLPGKKAILIVSAAVPGYAKPGTPNAEVLAQLHQRMVEEANAALANIFVIDPLGVSASLEMGQGDYRAIEGNVRTNAGQRSIAGAEWLSLNTGGLYLPSNDMRQSFDKVQRATTNYYELAYHAPQADEKYHHIAVTLKKPGRYTVTYREGYLRLSKEEGFLRAMTSPLGIASQKPTLPLELAVDAAERESDGGWAVPFRATLPVKSLQMLGREARAHIYVSAFDVEGHQVRFLHFVQTFIGVTASDERKLLVQRSIVLPAGKYRLFVTIRDELSDAVGIATKEISL